MRKIYSVLGSGLVAFTFLTGTVSAASGLNSSETTLIEYLDNFSYKYDGKEFTISDDLLTKIKSYLIKDDVELTDDQVNEVTKLVDEALVNLIKKNALNGSHLTNEQAKSFINDYIVPIANILNLEVSYDEDNLNVTIKDNNGQIIYSDNTIEDDDNTTEDEDDTTTDDNDDTEADDSDDTMTDDNDDTVTDNNNEENLEISDENDTNKTLPQTGSPISSTGVSILSTLMIVGGILLNKKKIK